MPCQNSVPPLSRPSMNFCFAFETELLTVKLPRSTRVGKGMENRVEEIGFSTRRQTGSVGKVGKLAPITLTTLSRAEREHHENALSK